MRFVRLSTLIILAGAIPAVAQNHATIGRSANPSQGKNAETEALLRQAIQDEHRGVEFSYKLHHLRFHTPVAGEAEIDHLAIKPPPQNRDMRHARARCIATRTKSP